MLLGGKGAEQSGCTAVLERDELTTAVVTFEEKEADVCLTLA